MQIAGIVAEYNPFHTGHQYHLSETRRAVGMDGGIICVMSGNWVQRGECAIGDKWVRASAALQGGADLILELPTLWATASAESFARGAVGILAATGIVTLLSFGTEDGRLDTLQKTALCLNSETYSTALRIYLDRGLSFAAARQEAVRQLIGPVANCLSTPNNNLAVEYLRALPPEIKAMTIPRQGVIHDGEASGAYASASQLRQWLRDGAYSKANPYLSKPWCGEAASMDFVTRAVLARLRTMSLAEAEALPDADYGLAARLLKAARRADDLPTLFLQAKTKRYAHARIRRMVLWAFLGLRAEDRPQEVPYLRVLGFNQRGQSLLREMKRKAQIPILTKPAHAKELSESGQHVFALEARCTDLYGLCTPHIERSGQEWTTGPVIHEHISSIR